MKFTIGQKVIPQRFEATDECGYLPEMDEYVGVSGAIQTVDYGYYLVHGYYWPASALTPVNDLQAEVDRLREVLIRIDYEADHCTFDSSQ